MQVSPSALHIAVGAFLCAFGLPAFACPECQHEVCALGPLGACFCVPTSGCILKEIPAPIRPPDPGKLTEKAKTDPIGALVNPFGVYNPTGIPQPGDLAEFAVKNPDQVIGLLQDPERVLYSPVVATIVSGRNAVVANGGAPIPDNIKPFLRRWHTQELIDSVRWTDNWSLVSSTLQAAQMRFNEDTRAIALINAVVFRDRNAANDPALWAHEMVHIQQYRDMGVNDFARSWVKNSARGGAIEAPGYARGEEARSILATSSLSAQRGTTSLPPMLPPVSPSGLPSGAFLGQCGCWGFVHPNAMAPSPVCASGAEMPRMCGPMGMCPGGGAPWARTCQ